MMSRANEKVTTQMDSRFAICFRNGVSDCSEATTGEGLWEEKNKRDHYVPQLWAHIRLEPRAEETRRSNSLM